MDGTQDPVPTSVRLDADALRVLAHPLRSRLLSSLRRGGPATATDLAATLQTNSGATSYHLRKLESVGLVADTGQGSGKARLWRAATDLHQWTVADFAGDEDSETALNWLVRDYLHAMGGRFEAWLDVEESWPVRWRDALGLGDTSILATVEQVEALRVELAEVTSRYRRIGEGHPDARRIEVHQLLYPTDLDGPPDTGDRSEG